MPVKSDAHPSTWIQVLFKGPVYLPQGRHASLETFGGEPFCGYYQRGETAKFPPLLAARFVAEGQADYV